MYKSEFLHTQKLHSTYKTVDEPERLYWTETLILYRNKAFEEILKKERKVFREILGPKYTNNLTYDACPESKYSFVLPPVQC